MSLKIEGAIPGGKWFKTSEYRNIKTQYHFYQPPHPNGTEEILSVVLSRTGKKAVVSRLTKYSWLEEDGTEAITLVDSPEKVLNSGDFFYFSDEYINNDELCPEGPLMYPRVYRIVKK